MPLCIEYRVRNSEECKAQEKAIANFNEYVQVGNVHDTVAGYIQTIHPESTYEIGPKGEAIFPKVELKRDNADGVRITAADPQSVHMRIGKLEYIIKFQDPARNKKD